MKKSLSIEEFLETRPDITPEMLEEGRLLVEAKIKGYELQQARKACRMTQKEVVRFCRLGREEERFAGRIYEARGISARGYHKVLKVARTIADLAGEEVIRKEHLAEAFGYRALEGRLWEKG